MMEYYVLYLLFIPLILLIATRRLLYSIYILIALVPLEHVVISQNYGINIKISEVMGLLCILFFLWNFLIKPEKKMFPTSLTLPLFIFALVNIILMLVAIPRMISYGNIQDLNSPGFRSIKVVAWCIYSILLALSISYAIKNKNDLKKCLFLLIGYTILLCIISLISFLQDRTGFKPMAPWALMGRAGIIGIDATFKEPSYFALYMSVIVPLALMLFILRIYRLGLFFSASSAFILILSNCFAFSTTGLVGLTFTLVAAPIFIRHYKLITTAKVMRFLVIILLGVYFVFLIAVLLNIDMIKAIVLNYFLKISTKEARWAAREMAQNMFIDHPIFGLGPGNWEWYSKQGYVQEITRAENIRPSYNCLYWEILVDLGIVGFIPFIWFFINLFRQLSRAIWKARDIFLKGVLVAFSIGFITLLMEYYVAFNFYRIHVWVFLGIAMAAIRLAKEESQAGNEKALYIR